MASVSFVVVGGESLPRVFFFVVAPAHLRWQLSFFVHDLSAHLAQGTLPVGPRAFVSFAHLRAIHGTVFGNSQSPWQRCSILSLLNRSDVYLLRSRVVFIDDLNAFDGLITQHFSLIAALFGPNPRLLGSFCVRVPGQLALHAIGGQNLFVCGLTDA